MLILGLIQSLISALVFGCRRPAHPSNLILALWFAILSLFFVGLLVPQGLVAYIKIGFVPFFLLTGPIFYFYVRSLIIADFTFHWRDLLHSIPFVVMSIVRVIYFPNNLNSDSFSGDQGNFYLLIFILLVSILSYWVATLLLLIRHRKNILNFFSDKSEKRTLNWVLPLMIVALVSHILFFSGPLLSSHFTSTKASTFWFQQFNMAMLGYLLLVFGLLQPVIFVRTKPGITDQLPVPDPANEKYARSGQSAEALQENASIILNYLDQEKPFTNPEYNLQTMIQDLDLSQQNLSQTINEHLGKNFYQLINEYRVREFQYLLRQPDARRFTILSLAYEAGFNSKSSFNRVFKEMTGLTPSQYQRRMEQE